MVLQWEAEDVAVGEAVLMVCVDLELEIDEASWGVLEGGVRE